MAFKDKRKGNEYIYNYQKEHYDRFNIMAPKGTKEEIRTAASLKNMTMSEFVLDCIQKELNRMKE